MSNKKIFFFFFFLSFLICLFIFDDYGLIKYLSLERKIHNLQERENTLIAKQIIYKERIKFLKSDFGGKLKKYY